MYKYVQGFAIYQNKFVYNVNGTWLDTQLIF